MSENYYTSTFSNKKLAILNIVLILFYLLYILAFVWFCTDFFLNTYSTELNTTAETIGFFLFICSIICICPVAISLCRVLFNTLKRRWIIYTPVISNDSVKRRRIDRYLSGITGGLLAAIFLVIVFILFFDRLQLTGFLSISLTFSGIIIADITGIILYKSYKLI